MILNPYRFAAGAVFPDDPIVEFLMPTDTTVSMASTGSLTVLGTLTADAEALGGLLLLDGTGDSVLLSITNPVASMGGGFSTAAWIKTAADGQIISNYVGVSSDGGFNFHVTGSKLRLIMGTDNFGSYIGKVSSASVDDNAWHHVCATWDGTEGDDSGIKLYIDGSDVTGTASSLDVGTFTFDTTTSFPRIGARGSNDQFFNGSMDGVRIYDRVLTGGEVGELNSEGHD